MNGIIVDDFELALKYLRESIKGGNEKANEKLLKQYQN